MAATTGGDDNVLTTEERETLDGCKLMQSILHDLDGALETTRSFAAHEDALYRQVIPVIQDTFESYDEDTAGTLQTFFGAYNMAVRYHVAHNTRQLLLEGDPTGKATAAASAPTYTQADLPDTKRLQEFGLEFVLKQQTPPVVDEDNDDDTATTPPSPAIDKVVLGCSQPAQVLDAVDIVRNYYNSQHPEEQVDVEDDKEK
jgi:hypothetical protein